MTSNPNNREKLNDICFSTPHLSNNLLKSYAEAGSICFESQGHNGSVLMSIQGDYNDKLIITWDTINDRIRRTYNDFQEAVEWGATAVSFLLVKKYTKNTVIERSFKSTGFDYWLGSNDDILFQRKSRLEISGILKETSTNSVKTRIKIKLSQIDRSNMNLPGLVIVVEFSKPLSEMRNKKNE